VPYTDPAYQAAAATRLAITNALFTFATSTLPPLVAAHLPTSRGLDPLFPLVAPSHSPVEDAAFYQACAVYVGKLIANGRYAGPAFPWP
jgi:hypothetical protein